MGIDKSIGQRIKQLRIEQQLSQEELARLIGYKSRSTINKIELGINDTTQTTIAKMAKALKTTPAYIMGWTQEREMPEISYMLNSDEKFVVDTMRSLNEQGVRYIVNNAQFASTQPDFINADDGKNFRAASSADNHDGEITTRTEEERERIAKATRMTSKNSNL